MKLNRLPPQFQIPFIGLLALLMISVYELLLPVDRTVWLVIAAATLTGAYQKPATAAALGWILVVLLGAYLAVNSALAPVSGASWLTLLAVPWLPPLASNVADTVRVGQTRLQRQAELLQTQSSLHPATSLPGLGLARQFLPILNANMRRQHHQGMMIELEITNLDLLRPLSTPEQLTDLQAGVRDALRGVLRGSDWIFQLRDDLFLVVADLGQRGSDAIPPEVEQLYQDIREAFAQQARHTAAELTLPNPAQAGEVLLHKLQRQLTPPPQLELQVRSLTLSEHLPAFDVLLCQLAEQPAQPLTGRPDESPVAPEG